MIDTYNLKHHVTKPTRQDVKTIDHVSSNRQSESILTTDVLPCPTISDHDTPHAILKIPTKSFQTRFDYIRNMKNFNAKEYYTDFSIFPFSTICSFDDLVDQLAFLNRLILDCTNQHAPQKRAKFTRPPAPWMKELEIIALQNWTNFRNIRNQLKKKIKNTKSLFHKRF